MKKTITILALIVVGVVMVVTVYLLGSKENPNTLLLSVSTNGGVPYKWEFEIGNPSIAEFVKSEVVEDKNDGTMVGAPITTNYIFKGVKSGITTITFKYVSVVDGSVIKEEKHTVKVGKDKNISYVVNLGE